MLVMMKPKRLLIGLMAVGIAASAFPTLVQAAGMKSKCSDCHTMHNSQNGATMSSAAYTTGNAQLLRLNCIGCHAGSTNNGTTVYPQVAGAGAQGVNMLAGGYFNDGSTAALDAKGHNVAGYSGPDVNFTLTGAGVPPGWENGVQWIGDTNYSNQVTCSGAYGAANLQYGCHQNGGHHTNNVRGTVTNSPTSVGTSYRFLSGVKGFEDAEWEWGSTASSIGTANHNQYYAVLRAKGDPDAGNSDTMNGLCAKCHGNFHGQADQDTGAGTGWIRHPTDVDLSTSATEHNTYANYDPLVPVGTSVVAVTKVTTLVQTGGNGIVLCISCHRPHGGDYSDLLRWSYGEMVAGSAGSAAGRGCFKCHSAKD